MQECDALALQLQLVSVALLDAVMEVCSVGLNSSVQIGLIKGSRVLLLNTCVFIMCCEVRAGKRHLQC